MTRLPGLPPLCAALMFSLSVGHSQPLSVSVSPTDDTFVTPGARDELSDSNFGAAGALAVSGSDAAKGEFSTYFRFDFTPARAAFDQAYGAGQWTVASAELRLTFTQPNHAIFNVNQSGDFAVLAYPDSSWQEGTGRPNAPQTTGLTFNSVPGFFPPNTSTELGFFHYSSAQSGSAVFPLSLPTGFALADNNISLALIPRQNDMSMIFNSSDFTVANNRPSLTFTAVPEPGIRAFLLLGSAMLFINHHRKRRLALGH